jgi:hypothetical protein
MNDLVKIRELKKGDKFYGAHDEVIHVFMECTVDEAKPQDIAYVARTFKSMEYNKYAIHGMDAINTMVYRYTGRDRSSFLAGFRAAMKICTAHMGSVDKENAGVDEMFNQHMTMMKAYKEWTKNFDDEL